MEDPNCFRVDRELWQLSSDPFAAAMSGIPRFRKFDIKVSPGTGGDRTEEFVTTLKAIHKVRPPNPVKIPRCAEFFNWDTVSEFELQFPFARDPQYQNIRNFMVSIYRLFSGHYLPFTLCRRNIKCPAHVVHQIWSFLTKYGLINFSIDPKTKPSSMVPTSDKDWPQLIYTPNDKLYTLRQYERRVHPSTPNPNIHPVPQFHMMACPLQTSDRSYALSEVPGLMTFTGNKTQMDALGLSLRESYGDEKKSVSEMTWKDVADHVRRSPEDCALQTANYPCSYPLSIEQTSGVLRTDTGGVHSEMCSGRELMKEMALSGNDAMRAVYRAVKGVGDAPTRNILAGGIPDMPENAEQAAATLALQKIAQNAEHMKKLHKQRILQCMDKMVAIMRETINMKQEMIERAKSECGIRVPTQTESDSDE